MVRTLLRVSVAAAVLSVLAHFYSDYRHTTYSINHGANAFDVFLWRLSDPGWYLARHTLPDKYTNFCCYDVEVLDHLWVVPTLVMFFNALIWSATATAVTFVVRRARNRRRPQPSNHAMERTAGSRGSTLP
jgi:hypothetical protein